MENSLQLLSEKLAGIMASSLWQGAVLAMFVAFSLNLAPRTGASLRFNLWSAAFLVSILLPFLHPVFHSPSVVVPSAILAAGKPLIQLDTRWSLAIAAVWLAASLYRTVDLAVHSLRLRKLWLRATPIQLDCNASGFASQRHLEICTTKDLDRPSVIGFSAPRVLIPEWLIDKLTPVELHQIVLHETQHLRRFDDWSNLFQKLTLILFPLNPVLFWIERRLCSEREMACDEAVVQLTHAPRAYATCLTRLADRSLRPSHNPRSVALTLGSWQRRSELVGRVHSILDNQRTLGPLGTGSLIAIAALGLILGGVELSRCPQLVAFVPAERPIAASVPNHAMLQVTSQETMRAEIATVPQAFVAKAKPMRRASSRSALPRIEADQPEPQFAAFPVDQLVGSAQEQAWIVLSSRQEPTTSWQLDAGQSPAQQPVTRLIFSITDRANPAVPVPASFAIPRFAAVPLSTGWLVIQL